MTAHEYVIYLTDTTRSFVQGFNSRLSEEQFPPVETQHPLRRVGRVAEEAPSVGASGCGQGARSTSTSQDSRREEKECLSMANGLHGSNLHWD